MLWHQFEKKRKQTKTYFLRLLCSVKRHRELSKNFLEENFEKSIPIVDTKKLKIQFAIFFLCNEMKMHSWNSVLSIGWTVIIGVEEAVST